MLEIPYWIAAIVYLIGVMIFLLFGSLYVSTMIRYGMFDARGKLYTLFFLIFSVVNLGLVGLSVLHIDWQQTITLSAPSTITIPGI